MTMHITKIHGVPQDESLYEAFLLVKQLMIFQGVSKDPVVSRLFDILAICISQKTHDPWTLLELYQSLVANIISWRETFNGYSVGSPWQDYIMRCLLEDENIFTQKIEQNQTPSLALEDAVKKDLHALQSLCFCEIGNLKRLVLQHLKQSNVPLFLNLTEQSLADWNGFQSNHDKSSLTDLQDVVEEKTHQVMLELLGSRDWREHSKTIAEYIRSAGAGVFAKYAMFRWISSVDSGHLSPTERPDTVRLKDLIGYDVQRFEIITNTEQFVHGYLANNVLLYGDRGTGKSSTVKALVNKYATTGKGLRLVEVSRDELCDLFQITQLLATKPQRFIIFVDDLSFGDGETGYRELKALLEGSTEVLPDNTLIYATSNRRHFVKETLSDNEEYRDEIRVQDSIQEKLSLADRFGITAVFLLPTRQKYLEIVETLADIHKIEMPKDVLRRRALEWEVRRNGRSPRSAQQFIRSLKGELSLSECSRFNGQ